MMTMEEKLLRAMFAEPTHHKDIHDLTEEERKRCNNGYNCCIEIVVDGVVVTGGTLAERNLITNSDVSMKSTLERTTIDDIIKTSKEEEIFLYIFEDLIMVISDIKFVSTVDRTYYLPIETDLKIFNETAVTVNDLR